MSATGRFWQMIDHLTAFLPAPPDGREQPPVVPDPEEPGISPDERIARRRLRRQGKEKAGKGGYR